MITLYHRPIKVTIIILLAKKMRKLQNSKAESINVVSNTSWFENYTVNGVAVKAYKINSILKNFKKIISSDFTIINIGNTQLFLICLLKTLLPFTRFKLVSVDLLLSKPQNLQENAISLVKKILLKNVDYFFLYMKDVAGYIYYFGIDPEKIYYVPFKINGYPKILECEISEGEYIFTGGATKRDYECFFKAVNGLPYRCVLLVPPKKQATLHGTEINYRKVPKNVEIVHNDFDEKLWVRYIANSKFVVLPIITDTISSTGISTYLLAMGLKKCVIISEGPATRQLIPANAAIIVPPGDEKALQKEIIRIFNDNKLRNDIAFHGNEYALSLKGHDRLVKDILTFIYEKHNHEPN